MRRRERDKGDFYPIRWREGYCLTSTFSFPLPEGDKLSPSNQKECEETMRTRKDWVVWSRARPAKGDCKLRGFEQEGKAVFQGKVKRKKKGQEGGNKR